MATTVRPRKYSNGRKVATGVLCVLGAFVLAASIGARSWVLTALGVALVGGGVALWIVSWAGETRVANAAAGRRPAPSAATASEDDVAEPLYGDSDLYGVADSDGTGTTTGSETGDDSRFIEMDLRPDLSGDGAPRPTVGRKDAPMGGWPGGDPRGDDFAQAPEGSAALAGTNNPVPGARTTPPPDDPTARRRPSPRPRPPADDRRPTDERRSPGDGEHPVPAPRAQPEVAGDPPDGPSVAETSGWADGASTGPSGASPDAHPAAEVDSPAPITGGPEFDLSDPGRDALDGPPMPHRTGSSSDPADWFGSEPADWDADTDAPVSPAAPRLLPPDIDRLDMDNLDIDRLDMGKLDLGKLDLDGLDLAELGLSAEEPDADPPSARDLPALHLPSQPGPEDRAGSLPELPFAGPHPPDAGHGPDRPGADEAAGPAGAASGHTPAGGATPGDPSDRGVPAEPAPGDSGSPGPAAAAPPALPGVLGALGTGIAPTGAAGPGPEAAGDPESSRPSGAVAPAPRTGSRPRPRPQAVNGSSGQRGGPAVTGVNIRRLIPAQPAVHAMPDAGGPEKVSSAYQRVTPPPGTPPREPHEAAQLTVHNLGEAVRFYRDDLGLVQVHVGTHLAMLRCDESPLTLKIDRRAKPGRGSLIHLMFEVDDVPAAYHALRERGVTFVHEPRVVSRHDDFQLWSAAFRDPDGHGLAFVRWVPAT